LPSLAPPVTATEEVEEDLEQPQQGAKVAQEIQPLCAPRSDDSRRRETEEEGLEEEREGARLQSFAVPPLVQLSIALPSLERLIPLTGEAPPACETKEATGRWLGEGEEAEEEGQRLQRRTLPSPAPVAASEDGKISSPSPSPPFAVAIAVTPPVCSARSLSVEARSLREEEAEEGDASKARTEPCSSPASSSRLLRRRRLPV